MHYNIKDEFMTETIMPVEFIFLNFVYGISVTENDGDKEEAGSLRYTIT